MIWILHYCAFKIGSPTTHGATRLLANLWELDYTGACGDYNGQNMLQGKCKERVWNFFCIKHRYNPNNFWSIRQNSQYRHKLIFKEILHNSCNPLADLYWKWLMKKATSKSIQIQIQQCTNTNISNSAHLTTSKYIQLQICLQYIRNTQYIDMKSRRLHGHPSGCPLYWDRLKNNFIHNNE